MSIKSKINSIVVSSFKRAGIKIEKRRSPDITDDDWNLYKRIEKLTMTPLDRIFALMDSIRYLQNNKIEGDFVECGVWRGGNAIIMAEIQNQVNNSLDKRDIWLYDTYDGMVEPDEHDLSFKGEVANEIYSKVKNTDGGSSWSFASFDFVKEALKKVDYPFNKFKLVKGKVEDTLLLKENIPSKIALLRLDTDWYQSTKIEMELLFPKLVIGGVLVIDDYGDWQGSRKAVDEYMSKYNVEMCLFRLGSGARIGIKTS